MEEPTSCGATNKMLKKIIEKKKIFHSPANFVGVSLSYPPLTPLGGLGGDRGGGEAKNGPLKALSFVLRFKFG